MLNSNLATFLSIFPVLFNQYYNFLKVQYYGRLCFKRNRHGKG
jgi:hypothetical protein